MQLNPYGYIFNKNNLTNDDRMIIVRRTVTCQNRIPIVEEFGNGYQQMHWVGDITIWPEYEEFDERYQ